MAHCHPEGLEYHKALLPILAFMTFYNHLYEKPHVYIQQGMFITFAADTKLGSIVNSI